SVACSTTQSRSAARVVSAQIPQISSMVKKPQRGQGRTDSRVAATARAMFSGWSPRAWTIQSAMRSAERGPIPGICRSCAIKSRSAAGYSVFLKTRAGSLGGHFRQVQSERLKPAQIQLQRRIVLRIRAACFLEFRVGFGPAFFSIKHEPVPERIASGEMLRIGLSRQPKWLVTFM